MFSIYIQRLKWFFLQNSSSKQTVIKNTFWLLVGEAVNKWSIFLVTLFIAQRLWPEQFWVFSYIVSFVVLYTVIVDYWLVNLVIRELSKHEHKENFYLINSLTLKILLWIINVIIVYATTLLFPSQPIWVSLIILYCLYTIINNIWEFMRVFFRVQEHMQHEAFLKIINGMLFTWIITYSLFSKGDITSLIYAFLVSWIINLSLSAIYVFRYFNCTKPSQYFDTQILFSLLKKWSIIALWILFVNFYINFDQFLLWYYGLTYDLGIYALGYKMTFIYTIVFAMVFQTFLPRIAKNPTLSLYKQWIKRVSYINGILIFIYWSITYFLYIQTYWNIGPYKASLIVFLLLLLYCVFESYAHRWYIHLLALKKDKQILRMFWVCAACNIGLNLVVIPHYSYMWAIAVNILTYLLYFFISWLFVHRWYQHMMAEQQHKDQMIPHHIHE